MLLAQLGQFVLNQTENTLTSAKDVLVIGDLDDKILVFLTNLVSL